MNDQVKPHAQNRDSNQIVQRQLCADQKRSHQRKQQRKRRTDRNANDHHKGVLNIGHISGQPCDDAGRGKLINIGK